MDNMNNMNDMNSNTADPKENEMNNPVSDERTIHKKPAGENEASQSAAKSSTDQENNEDVFTEPSAGDQKDGENEEASLLPMVIEQMEEEELDELQRKNAQADKVILGFTVSAGATGAIPLPLADTPLLIAQQVAMIAKLSDVYGINMKKSGLRSLVFTVLGVSGTTVLGKTITSSLLKLLPGIGTLGGAAICGTTGAALTAALGKAYSEVCQSVFLGELDEDELLKAKGRMLLETSFKNHLRLEMDQNKQAEKDAQDVLKQASVPQDNIPVHMETAHHSQDCLPAIAPEENEDKEEKKANSEAQAVQPDQSDLNPQE